MLIEYVLLKEKWEEGNHPNGRWEDIEILEKDSTLLSAELSQESMRIELMQQYQSMIKSNTEPGSTRVKILIRPFLEEHKY